jgi:predicted transposase YdaD
MTSVIVRLGNPQEESKQEIINILNALFNPRDKKSYEVLNKHIDFSKALEQEVNEMDGLGASIFFEGVEEGKAEAALGMYQEGLSVNQIAKILKMTVEKVEKIIEEQAVLA